MYSNIFINHRNVYIRFANASNIIIQFQGENMHSNSEIVYVVIFILNEVPKLSRNYEKTINKTELREQTLEQVVEIVLDIFSEKIRTLPRSKYVGYDTYTTVEDLYNRVLHQPKDIIYDATVPFPLSELPQTELPVEPPVEPPAEPENMNNTNYAHIEEFAIMDQMMHIVRELLMERTADEVNKVIGDFTDKVRFDPDRYNSSTIKFLSGGGQGMVYTICNTHNTKSALKVYPDIYSIVNTLQNAYKFYIFNRLMRLGLTWSFPIFNNMFFLPYSEADKHTSANSNLIEIFENKMTGTYKSINVYRIISVIDMELLEGSLDKVDLSKEELELINFDLVYSQIVMKYHLLSAVADYKLRNLAYRKMTTPRVYFISGKYYALETDKMGVFIDLDDYTFYRGNNMTKNWYQEKALTENILPTTIIDNNVYSKKAQQKFIGAKKGNVRNLNSYKKELTEYLRRYVKKLHKYVISESKLRELLGRHPNMPILTPGFDLPDIRLMHPSELKPQIKTTPILPQNQSFCS